MNDVEHIIRPDNKMSDPDIKRPLTLPLSKDELNKIIHVDWKEFSDRYMTDGLQELRNELWGTIYSRTHTDCKKVLHKMRKLLGFPDLVTDEILKSPVKGLSTQGTYPTKTARLTYNCNYSTKQDSYITFYL